MIFQHQLIFSPRHQPHRITTLVRRCMPNSASPCERRERTTCERRTLSLSSRLYPPRMIMMMPQATPPIWDRGQHDQVIHSLTHSHSHTLSTRTACHPRQSFIIVHQTDITRAPYSTHTHFTRTHSPAHLLTCSAWIINRCMKTKQEG